MNLNRGIQNFFKEGVDGSSPSGLTNIFNVI